MFLNPKCKWKSMISPAPKSGVLAVAPFHLSVANAREEGDWVWGERAAETEYMR